MFHQLIGVNDCSAIVDQQEYLTTLSIIRVKRGKMYPGFDQSFMTSSPNSQLMVDDHQIT